MKKFISIITALLLILSPAAATPVFAQESQNICDELDRMIQSMVENDKSKGAVLSIVKEGKIELCKGYGFADEYMCYDADGEKTAFRIGSVSKTFAAVAAQILEEEGKLDMDSDISIYLESDFPKLSYPVTMKQLLTHTAGFEDMVTGIAVRNVSDTEDLSVSVRKYLPAQINKPGEIISYSNYGIALAAYVIECITNQDYSEFCQEHIFTPLDMNRTTFKYMQNIVYVSKPYLPNGNETLEPYMNLYPEGSVVSTAEDMAKYMQWLLNNSDMRILSSTSKNQLFTKQFTMSQELEGIGYIWNRKSRNDEIYYEKKGETLNFYTRTALFPKAETGVFLSFNTYVSEHEINAVIDKAANLLYGENQYNIDSPKSSINIKGVYVNNWSSFKTPEKILRYLIPGKMLYISGTEGSGYIINGKDMTLIGDNAYSSDAGILKFQSKNNTVIMSSESALTYTRVPLWQHIFIQVLIPLAFIITTSAVFLMEMRILPGRNIEKNNLIFLFSSLIQIFSFIALCLLMYKAIATYSLLGLASYLKICGWVIFLVVVFNTIYIIYVKVHSSLKGLSPIIWNLSGILFSLWIFWFNII